jgi:hypothetical protein
MASIWFNEDQQAYIEYLATIPPEQKCWCGWYKVNECPHCPSGKTSADKIAVRCPECHNDPGPEGDRPIIHRKGCSKG